ncbi:mannitol dehydrogenase family protein [Kineococcus sp. LSe6-4]|uniref:Mannitol-1-phosphate 5-dehydrogenase n=1 Tax=Kineococcus halophytocola TaxID=3234027 RepID=A0ABV4H1F3_9ACTN
MSSTPPIEPLRRQTPAPPVRIVHLGLGNFHRAHQAWYTAHAGDAAQWGIAAFTGRRPDAAERLNRQDGLYTLLVRGADGDHPEVVTSLSRAYAATDHEQFLDLLRRSEVAVVTLTVTEAAYLLGPDGGLDVDRPEVRADADALRADPTAPVTTVPGRLAAGLAARRAAGAGPITVLSCDNLAHNGAVTAAVVTRFADLLDPGVRGWVQENVEFASSMVDRITPATTEEVVERVAELTGRHDESPVPTEPFSEWVVAGEFAAGRPDWESAGAVFVEDVTAHEQRKLWLLNGSHSLLAYAGGLLGHRTIADAVADPRCRSWVEEFWDEACRHLPFPDGDLRGYREALLDRYANPGVRHLLAQIAAGGSLKLPLRVVPALRAERAADRLPRGCATAVAAWIGHLRGEGTPVDDPAAEPAVAAATSADPVRDVLSLLDPGLGDDGDLVDLVSSRLRDLAPGNA